MDAIGDHMVCRVVNMSHLSSSLMIRHYVFGCVYMSASVLMISKLNLVQDQVCCLIMLDESVMVGVVW